MDPLAVWGAVLFTGSAVVAIAVYASQTRAKVDNAAVDLEDVSYKVRNLDNWRLTILPTELNANFARKDTVAAELASIKESLKRIETHQAMMAQRFMNGGAGL